MDVLQQIRTHQGKLLSKGATLLQEPVNTLEFELLDAGQDQPQHEPREQFGLEELATARTLNRINLIAEETGPLFGQSNKEKLEAWTLAMASARQVLSIQQYINGHASSPDEFAYAMLKETVTNTSTGAVFLNYTLSFKVATPASNDYFLALGPAPWCKRFADAKSFDYALCSSEEIEGSRYYTINLFCFPTEITSNDFLAVLDTSFDEDSDVFQQQSQLLDSVFPNRNAAETAFALLDPNADFQTEECEIDETDKSHLQRIVYALASVHLDKIKMDIFQSNESDDFMVFPHYLSYLWYKFARQTGQVKMGFCEQCHQGFSLAGHRGIARRFCSEACKTKAKNARTKAQRDETRALFLNEGKSVREIAKIQFPDKTIAAGKKQVIGYLRNSKELRHKLKEDPALIIRCVKEEVLSAKEGRARLEDALRTNPALASKIERLIARMR